MTINKLPANPIDIVLQLIGAKWKIRIISELIKREMRFTELKKKLGCTAKVLTACLKEMEHDGLIIREQEKSTSNVVEYYLTDIGYTIRPIIESMQKWGSEYKKYLKLVKKLEGDNNGN